MVIATNSEMSRNHQNFNLTRLPFFSNSTLHHRVKRLYREACIFECIVTWLRNIDQKALILDF